jgi:hypothetical protein
MTLHAATRLFLVLALALPMVHIVFVWVRGLLTSMGDNAGAAMIGHLGTACLAAWPISLVGLIIVTAIVQLIDRPPKD